MFLGAIILVHWFLFYIYTLSLSGMLQTFKQYLDVLVSHHAPARILLAVSGGIDSMVMLHLAAYTNHSVAVAHCNFGLRGASSDADEQFVRDAAQAYQLPFFSVRFDTLLYSKEWKKGTQETARILRYNWFETLCNEHQFDYVATAHHANDSAETMLYNLAKGSGIRGLAGIPPINGRIIRPLLFSSRSDITHYATTYRIAYRTDESNTTDKYARNYIRHQIVPHLQKINPALEKTLLHTAQHLSEAQVLLCEVTQQMLETARISEHPLKIKTELLLEHRAAATILYEWLRPYQFERSICTQLLEGIRQGRTGSVYLSPTHRALVNRGVLELATRTPDTIPTRLIPEEGLAPYCTIRYVDIVPTSDIPKNRAYLDADAIQFPLVLRGWQQGDYFYPNGMGGQRKKLSDLFNDCKLSVFDKERVRVLTTGEHICWVVGLRTDQRFAYQTATTRRVVEVTV
jgi:tRNA(Ile)-lysidine synthase